MSRWSRRWALGLAIGVAGCGDDGTAAPPDAAPVAQMLPPHALDVLFVIDNTGGMEGVQTSVANNFDRFTSALAGVPGGMPSLHLGVVSSNAGAGGQPADGCDGDGDDGRLQYAARGLDCVPPDGAFISFDRDEVGNEITNYTGSLEETYGCIGRLGTGGCGFEQHLESMRRALDGHNVENEGFLRPEAQLAIVILADEDDCSGNDPAMYDPAEMTLADPLGPATSFRCFEFGVTCDGLRPAREAAELDPLGGARECEPAGARSEAEAEYLWHPQVYIEFLKGLKADPSWIMVAGIVGDREPVTTSIDSNGNPRLDSSCGLNGVVEVWGTPAIRIGAFLDAFPGHNTFRTICEDDLSDGLGAIAERIARGLTRTCLTGNVDPTGCSARDAGGVEVAVTLVLADECSTYPTGFAVVVDGGPRAATGVVVTCPGR